ncbi:MAG: aspartate carbamoyltransferase catalytic subunit [Candidatus Hydrothermales bacterium]
MKRKDLLSLRELEKKEIETILDLSEKFLEILKRPIPKVPTLKSKTICNLFFEPSTRTRLSFELAAKRLSADVINFTASASSIQKGESTLDTLKNILAMKVDMFVVRHSYSGAVHFLAKNTSASVVNAGDGTHEHPTQGLLDIFTMRKHLGDLKGKKVLIIGDILHSRVARSNLFGLLKLGAEVFLAGPAALVPDEFEKLGAKILKNIDKEIGDMDVIMGLRIQKERGGANYIPSFEDYRRFFGITTDRLKLIKENAIIMHPGPVNWGVEMDYEVSKDKRCVILEQVTNGVAVRMAVLFYLLGTGEIKGE